MSIKLDVIFQNGQVGYYAVYDFLFKKDVYTPYTTLEFHCKYINPVDSPPHRVKFYYNDILIHDGLIDKAEWVSSHYDSLYRVTSRGFTSQLMQNQIAPGLYPDKTFNQLMSEFISLPNVTYENGETSSYIFVKYGSSMWEAVENFCYKVYHRYPYINGPNNVAISQRSNPASFVIPLELCFKRGFIYDYRKLISHFHMQDFDGTNDAFNYTDSFVTQRLIHREKHYEYDQQYNAVPIDALNYRNAFSKRASKEVFCEYHGYYGEDLNDKFTLPNFIDDLYISKIEVTGKNGKVSTKTSAYVDNFNNPVG